MRLLASCAPGLEVLLAGELVELGLLKPRLFLGPPPEPGGVAFEGGIDALYRACRRLRLAERVLVRQEPFPASDFAALAKGAARVPWESYLAPGRPLAVRVECRDSRLYHEKAVAERVAEGVASRLKAASALVNADDDPDAAVLYVKVVEDVCSIDVDGSGAPLHRRGWRFATGKAPLRETLAAGLLRASGWDGRAPLLDPFCGSGTIAIEAALTARGIAAGGKRGFAFQRWPGYDAAVDGEAAGTACAAPTPPRILASDRDAGAVESARANAARAGVADDIEFSVRAVSAIEPPRGPGWVVTNPPYGVRVSEGKDLRDLYAGFGKALRAKCVGWRVTLLTSEPPLARNAGLGLEPGLSTLNGGLPVQLWQGRA